MKWLTTILAFYLLTLSLWPCADEPLPVARQAEPAMTLSVSTTESGGAHHHEHDACTPFCTCACCAATITVSPQSSHTLTSPVEIVPIAVTRFSYASAHPLDPITAIWQPPQLRV
ncbi:DUF6660 family protein [Spirosoma humi]